MGVAYKKALTDTEKWLLHELGKNPSCKMYKGYLTKIKEKKKELV
jgi:hypothetical protein